MNNFDKLQASTSCVESIKYCRSSAPVKSIKMIAAQRQHVKKLQEKLKDDEKNFFATLTSIDGWEYFMTRHTSTYQRPKEVIPYLKNFFKDIDIVFDKEEGIPTTAAFTITYTRGYSGYKSYNYKSYNYLKFRTQPIPISEIEEFIENKE